VKGGASAEYASDGQVRAYLAEAIAEARNYETSSACPAGTTVSAIAVRKTPGYGSSRAGNWEVIAGMTADIPVMIRLTLDDYLTWIGPHR
jgi:hypothetical protein